MMTTGQHQELYRKTFHVLGILLIPVSLIQVSLVPWILLAAVIFYGAEELLARDGRPIPFITNLINRCKRSDTYTRIDAGPFYLAFGVGIPFLFFPLPVAQISLLHVCLADAAASLAAHFLPADIRLPHSKDKSWTGTVAFWLIAFLCSWIYLPIGQAVIVAAVGALLESFSLRDLDNIVVPIGVALFITLMGWIPA